MSNFCSFFATVDFAKSYINSNFTMGPEGAETFDYHLNLIYVLTLLYAGYVFHVQQTADLSLSC